MIIVPVCNRTNYSKLKPVLEQLPKDSFQLVLSSSILLEQYGYAYKDIELDGYKVLNKIDCLLSNDSLEAMIKTMAISLIEHSNVFKHSSPKGLLVVGDRFDMLPSVLSARVMNIPIFHIQGGEKTGSIDDYIRDMITICADRHYVATDNAKKRVEEITGSKNVFNFGCPAVEKVASTAIDTVFDISHLHKKFKHKIPINPYDKFLLICVHPNTTDSDIDMEVILQSVFRFNMKSILLYPNADAFHGDITLAIRKHANDKISLIKHAPLEDFIQMMAHTSCMIGNSSAGIREAALFGTPVVNIGNRQKNRERNINTIDVTCDSIQITDAVRKSLEIQKYKNKNIYYKQNSAQNIAKDIIKTLD